MPITIPSTSPPGGGTVLVTGAAGGLGRALCRAFLDAGWRVIAGIHRRPMAFSDPGMEVVPLDVTDPGAADRVLGRIGDGGGSLEVLVNNAGITRDAALPRLTDADWEDVHAVHLTGAFRCARAALSLMRRNGRGHIINIGSFGGRTGRAGQANYTSAKAGLLGLSAALAREGGPDGIQVNTVLPGFMDTALVGHLTGAQLAAAAADNLLGRLSDPAESARFVVHLAGMRNVSGQVFSLDSRISRWG